MEDLSVWTIIQLLTVIATFIVMSYAFKFIVNKIKTMPSIKNSKFFNIKEYFPTEEIYTLRQLFYLIMVLIFIIIDLYLTFEWTDGIQFIIFLDILISIYIAVNMDWNSYKNVTILFLLIPISSISRILFGDTILVIFDILHIIGYIYLIEEYYRKFLKYTEKNGLGITIILLFSIVLVSFLFTILAENVSPLDSIVMVTNAFTSNSFEASGNSLIGKLDSLVLAWGGFILSGVGTATLSVSIIRRYVDRQFDDMEEMIKNKKK